MRSATARPSPLRALRFENLEDRIVFSGRPGADFWLDQSLLQRPSDVFEQVEVATPLAEVHDQFGVTYARNTFGFTGAGQTVVVIDSGVAYDHDALGGGLGSHYRVVGGWDFTEENDANPYDDPPAGFHGTHVAGIVGSDDPDHLGVAPEVDLVALRVFNDQGIGYFDWVEQALGWVHQHQNDFAHPVTTVTLSLGANWNSDHTPTWATLEDELAQLNRDGIFVAVAAGNGFQNYQTAGLSYPAASPYVVPVASVSSNGLLSSFSQRNSRVLAAPGEQITSTVPDYLYTFDGVTNDYASATGTSMAAPYVAGASVLVREALQFAGYTHVTQDMIYDRLGETADSVFDAITGQSYRRINLQSALAAIMPADEYGSTAVTAFNWGTLSANATATGIIGQLDDVDYFRFTAGVSGVATFSVTTADALAPELVGAGARAGDTALTFDVVAGRQYVMGVGSGEGIGHYETRVEIVPQTYDLPVTPGGGATGNDDLSVAVRPVSGPDQVGFHRDRAFHVDLNGNGIWAGPAGGDASYYFGQAGDTPIIGDFNGDGTQEIGFYRSSAGAFCIDLNGNGIWEGPAGGDASYFFGQPGDTPIIGDFNGDGADEIGFYRSSAGTFCVDLNGDGVWEGPAGGDASYFFGQPGDTPIIGDFNGDGTDEIGFYRSSARAFCVDLNGDGIWEGPAGGDARYFFGQPGDTPIIGDFNGDGTDEIGYHRGNAFCVDLNGDGIWQGPAGGDARYFFGQPGDTPIIGNWASIAPLPAASGPALASLDTADLTTAGLATIVDHAAAIFAAATITLDINAAADGWLVDPHPDFPLPTSDFEMASGYENLPHSAFCLPDSCDPFTAVMLEIGHLPTDLHATDGDSLTSELLAPGNRHLPIVTQIDATLLDILAEDIAPLWQR